MAIDPTFTSVGVLGLIVSIRTFLSFSLELGITGRWPWQSANRGEPSTGGRQPAADDPSAAR